MAELAAKLGVSRIAVSMALRDHHRISTARDIRAETDDWQDDIRVI